MANRKRDSTNVGGSVEAAAVSVSSNDKFLADVIRTADIDAAEANVEKRTRFIKDQLDRMTEDQLTRFEFFVRSHLSRQRVKDILLRGVGLSHSGAVTDEMAIVVGGLAKLFVGELVETATEVLGERNDASGLRVSHLEEAKRRMKSEGKLGNQGKSLCPLSKDRLLQPSDDLDAQLEASV